MSKFLGDVEGVGILVAIGFGVYTFLYFGDTLQKLKDEAKKAAEVVLVAGGELAGGYSQGVKGPTIGTSEEITVVVNSMKDTSKISSDGQIVINSIGQAIGAIGNPVGLLSTALNVKNTGDDANKSVYAGIYDATSNVISQTSANLNTILYAERATVGNSFISNTFSSGIHKVSPDGSGSFLSSLGSIFFK